jgi:CBS domain-containing protein
VRRLHHFVPLLGLTLALGACHTADTLPRDESKPRTLECGRGVPPRDEPGVHGTPPCAILLGATRLCHYPAENEAMSLIELAARNVETVGPDCTLVEASRRMVEKCVGSLVITDPSEEVPLGIVTDRDLVVLLAKGADPATETLASLTRPHLETVRVGDELQHVTHKMRKHGVRRLPVLDVEGRLAGIVSMDDVLVLLGREMADLALAVEGELAHERATRSGGG